MTKIEDLIEKFETVDNFDSDREDESESESVNSSPIVKTVVLATLGLALSYSVMRSVYSYTLG